MMKINKIYLAGIFIILALPLVSWSIWFAPADWGKTIIFRSIMAVMLFLLAYQFLYKKQANNLQNLKKNKIVWLLAGLFGIFLLASIFSIDPYFSFWGSPIRSGGFINFAFYIIFGVIAFLILKEKEWKLFLNWSIIIGIIVSCVALIQYFNLMPSIFVTPIDHRPSSTIGNPISMGIYLLLLFFPAAFFFIKEEKLHYKIFYGSSILLFLYVILISGSRAVYLGLIMGLIYFLLFYPRKLRVVKISLLLFLIVVIGIVYYANTQSHFPSFLENNRLFQSVQPRLSVPAFLSDGRFSAWQMGFKAFSEKPILGWGPENYSVGFDKYYDVSSGYPWWDRAHNVPLEIATTAGFPALIIYLALFAVLFWQLGKLKKKPTSAEGSGEAKQELTDMGENPQLIAHSLQATLIAYFVANVFSFDSFSSYLLFFFIIGYSLHLINNSRISENPTPVTNNQNYKKNPYKLVAISVLACVLAWFLWQYNIVPLQINAQINSAKNRINYQNCDKGFLIMDNAIKQHSFLDSYAASEYIGFVNACGALYPENSLIYAKKGVLVLQEVVKIQPSYTRFWIYLAGYIDIEANLEQNPTLKNALIQQAYSYLDKASKLAANHPEVLIEKARTDAVAGNYQQMKASSTQCIAKDPSLGNCYFIKAISEIYLGDLEKSKEDMQTASSKNYNIHTFPSLGQLIDAYSYVKNYKELATAYEEILKLNPQIAQYHSSLAFVYSKLGQYAKAREQALIVLQLRPEQKDAVNAFLNTLPR